MLRTQQRVGETHKSDSKNTNTQGGKNTSKQAHGQITQQKQNYSEDKVRLHNHKLIGRTPQVYKVGSTNT